LHGSYESIIGCDSGYALASLTGGMILRLSPTRLVDKSSILSYLTNLKKANFIVGLVGAELTRAKSNSNVKDRSTIQQSKRDLSREGHSYSLIDLVESKQAGAIKSSIYVKLRNCQLSMLMFKQSKIG
jgi:hypothetical protein